MASGLLNLVCILHAAKKSHLFLFSRGFSGCHTMLTYVIEHTLLVTETGVEVLTAANENSPGGAVPMPTTTDGIAEVSGANDG